METRRWTNPGQPQTLQIAVFLLYFRGVFGLLFQSSIYFAFGALGFLAMAAFVAAGFGIANEKKWGYQAGVGVALGEVALYILFLGPFGVFGFRVFISFAFAVALAALLLHPQSRDYQKIWFQ
jgi:hypothetical protein